MNDIYRCEVSTKKSILLVHRLFMRSLMTQRPSIFPALHITTVLFIVKPKASRSRDTASILCDSGLFIFILKFVAVLPGVLSVCLMVAWYIVAVTFNVLREEVSSGCAMYVVDIKRVLSIRFFIFINYRFFIVNIIIPVSF